MKVKGHNNLLKDFASGAVVNTDISSMRAARERRAAQLQEKERFNNLEKEVSDIKILLEKIIGKLND